MEQCLQEPRDPCSAAVPESREGFCGAVSVQEPNFKTGFRNPVPGKTLPHTMRTARDRGRRIHLCLDVFLFALWRRFVTHPPIRTTLPLNPFNIIKAPGPPQVVRLVCVGFSQGSAEPPTNFFKPEPRIRVALPVVRMRWKTRFLKNPTLFWGRFCCFCESRVVRHPCRRFVRFCHRKHMCP